MRLHEEAGNVQSAAEALEKYSNSGPRKNLTLAHLVELTARFDSDRAEKLSLGLPPLPSDASIDVDALENSTSRRAVSSRAPAAESSSLRKGGAVDADRAARIRVRCKAKKTKSIKKKLRASFNPKHQPDVNKWIPYADRPGSKRRNWKKDAVRGSQGTVAPAATVASAAAASASPVAAAGGGGSASHAAGIANGLRNSGIPNHLVVLSQTDLLQATVWNCDTSTQPHLCLPARSPESPDCPLSRIRACCAGKKARRDRGATRER